MLVFLDLETGGLNPLTQEILEIGIIVTDDDLNEIGRWSRVLHTLRCSVPTMDPVAREMHEKSGLLTECLDVVQQRSDDQIEEEAIEYLSSHGVPEDKPPLCGSTIGFDRSFLKEQMPALLACFHYRSIDVSTLTELARRWYPEVYSQRPGADESKRPHRALADLEFSIALLKYYRRTILNGTAVASAMVSVL